MNNPWGDFHYVKGAGWQLFWRIPEECGGMELWFGHFNGKRVFWKASQPFAIVPYHHPLTVWTPPFPPTTVPAPPEFSFKDGLGPQCGGAGYTPLKWWAPNGWISSVWFAGTDREVVQVEVTPETTFDPAELTISAKFSAGWYQYVQRWSFNGYGEIHAELGMGGRLHPFDSHKAHVHHMYFRLDLGIDWNSKDVFEVFSHTGFDDAVQGDRWTIQPTQGKHLLDPNTARKFRVRAASQRRGPQTRALPGFEIEIPAQAPTDTHSTADVWATVYRGAMAEQGESVGRANCNDLELEQLATGPFDITHGSDVVLWVVVRHHHEPRHLAEESSGLPFHYQGFHIRPRGFETFRSLNDLYPLETDSGTAPAEPRRSP
jgi:hypothetical protein